MGLKFFLKTYFTLFKNNTASRKFSVIIIRKEDALHFLEVITHFLKISFPLVFLTLGCLHK